MNAIQQKCAELAKMLDDLVDALGGEKKRQN